MPSRESMIAALLREREALKTQGKDERVEQVDEQLLVLDYVVEEPKTEQKPNQQRAQQKPQAPQGRTPKPGNQATT